MGSPECEQVAAAPNAVATKAKEFESSESTDVARVYSEALQRDGCVGALPVVSLPRTCLDVKGRVRP